ncbi:carbamoyltransferase C-terminal domain-containing protein [Vulcanisaeta moutnovskia]|uniref:carbamoyltransferase C-terminal domain-containing protein n=1 Tax=Vulcanisaeta moutnovskia TaxID=985052 RepID=UPI0009FF5FFD|nr:carbamoyltransferase C-terminal domain-containing protein [Vulcanisaeta moutnovskia]
MGLAPYGQKSRYYEKLRSYFRFDDKDYPYYISVDGSRPRVVKGDDATYMRPYRVIANSLFPGRVPWNPRGDLNRDAVDLAWAVQAVTEEAMLRLAEWAREHTGEDRLALAGGVALNAKANMAIHYAKLFNEMFIFPAANDAGTTVGAAAYVYEHVLGGKMRNQRLRTVYLGPEYSDDEIKKIVERSRFEARYIGDDVNEVAELIAKGNVIAWYQGRAELGPRALGNRSIVADPRRREMWRLVNDIKGREWWRPLAPSLLVEDAGKYFIDPVPHQFMILMFKFREGMGEVVPAVYHVDGTARPQTVAKDENPTWYELIKAFKDLTGEGIILNTSFNLAGEPLVETPSDALKSFALGGFDVIYINPVEKEFTVEIGVQSLRDKLISLVREATSQLSWGGVVWSVIDVAREAISLGRGRIAIIVDDVFQAIGIDRAAIYVKGMLGILEHPPRPYERVVTIAATSEVMSLREIGRHEWANLRPMWNIGKEGFRQLYEQIPGGKPDFEEAWRLTGGNPRILEMLYKANWDTEAVINDLITRKNLTYNFIRR